MPDMREDICMPLCVNMGVPEKQKNVLFVGMFAETFGGEIEEKEGRHVTMTAMYMLVSEPPLCLPEAVADSVNELAAMLGITAGTISSAMYRDKKHNREGRFVKVEFEEEVE